MIMINGYIISYINPDTDGICSSIAYSYYLEKHKKIFVPIITGSISDETLFVLKKAGINLPLANHNINANDKIILMDTHNILQLPHLQSPESVIEIVDHHTDGDLDLFKNAKITNKPIGAVASIIAERIINDGVMNESIAILLGSAIISNTVNFSAPSTTNYDKKLFSQLKKYYEFDKNYITEMFHSKNSILEKPPCEVLASDEKKYSIDNNNIKIAQLELVNVEENVCFEEMHKVMQNIFQYEKLDVYIVSFIDVVNLKTYILAANEYSSKIVQLILNLNYSNTVYKLNRVLLRKTDIIPKLHDAIAFLNRRFGG